MAAAGDRHHRRGTAAERRCGCVGAPARRRRNGPRTRAPVTGREGLVIGGRRAGFVPGAARRGRRCLPGDRRRRPAQVFYGVPNRWDVGMSKPNAFACSATPRTVVGGEGFEPSGTGPVESHLPPERRVREHAPVTTVGRGRPSVRLGAGLARARERPTRPELIRDGRQIVKWNFRRREIASQRGLLHRGERTDDSRERSGEDEHGVRCEHRRSALRQIASSGLDSVPIAAAEGGRGVESQADRVTYVPDPYPLYSPRDG